MCPYFAAPGGSKVFTGFSRDHLRTCTLLRWSWMSLLVTFSLFVQPAMAVDGEARTNRIQIEYAAPRNADHQELYEFLKQQRALEKLQEIFSPFRLPVDLTLRALGCDGVSNAWYQQGVVSVCYEYIREIYEFAPKETTASGITPADAVLGQFFYVFAHEMGHAVYDVLKIPVLGTEEDAADHFAAYTMLQFGRNQARRLIVGAAYAYDRYLRNPTVTVPLLAFSGSHSPPAQRFFNLICLAYGSDSVTVFADLVELGYLPSSRAPRCKREFNQLSFAFRQLILPDLDKEMARKVLDATWLPDTAMPKFRK
jgi:Putative metallopeptidase